MSTVFISVLTLFIFLAVGFALARCGIVKHEHSGLLSRLLVWVFLPANIIKTFGANCTVRYLSDNYPIILISLGILSVILVLMHFLARCLSRDKVERGIFEYSLIIPNFGYMGYALVGSVFGDSALMTTMMFAIPLSLYTYTVGFCILSGKKFAPKSLFNPTLVSMVLGILLGVSGIGAYMPSVIDGALSSAAACMGPVSMILTGIVISGFGIRTMFTDIRVYAVSLLRLLAIPLAVGGVLLLLGFEQIVPYAVILYAMPCGLNTVVFVKNAGGDPSLGARLALISSALVCFTAPLVSLIMGIVA
jgi:predicted permease